MIDLFLKAIEIFNSKMSRPQYKDYQNNLPLQKLLFKDCLKEAMASVEIDGTVCCDLLCEIC